MSSVEIVYCSGVGAYADIYRISLPDNDGPRPVVIKLIRDQLSARRESSVLNSLNHPNIVRMFAYIEDGPHNEYLLVLESMEESLHHRIAKLKFDVNRYANCPFVQRVRFLIDAAKGLEYLHTRSPRVIHRDLKGDNLLINIEGVVKICDFGTAKELQVGRTNRPGTTHDIGTYYWMAPEVLRGPGEVASPPPVYTVMCDIYSFGMTIYEVSILFLTPNLIQ